MPIPDPLRCYFYEHGWLVQGCVECRWLLRGHAKEFAECPACGARLKPPLAIAFGGMGVVFTGTKFILRSITGERMVIDRVDIAETIQFMCRHAAEDRSGRPPGGKRFGPQTQLYDQDIEDLLFRENPR